MFLFPFWLMWQLLYEGSDSGCYSFPEVSGNMMLGEVGGKRISADIATFGGEVLDSRPLWSLQGQALIR
jgi:hypothetical protein